MASNGTPAAPPKPVRCAIYTRKSTEEGLQQAFNSLDAQREAAEAYIRSQAGEGFTLLPGQYDDGGYTGANMDRPALKRLLADVQAGKADCVMVYKVDRLTRSLLDFARIMEVLDRNGASFVSVTQQFNTTTSLGRLTLNILLSFAQFEREIISERTRDKQSAARKKGKWTGGHLILGYDLDPRGTRLIVNPEEAERVREIFGWYLEGVPVSKIVEKLDHLGWRNKEWTTREGKVYGGSPLRKGHIYKLLANVLYSGRLKVAGELYSGEHEAIVEQQTFDLVQAHLNQNGRKPDGTRRIKHESLLRGLLYCSCCGSKMFMTYSASRERRYRYFVCYRAQQKVEGYCTTLAVSAPAVEEAVVESIRRVGVHPRVLAETAGEARQRIADSITELREELKAVQIRVKNFKSQLARMRQPGDAQRVAGLEEQIADGERRTSDLKQEIQRREQQRVDEKELRETLESFEDVWKALNLREQSQLVRQLVEKVGVDGRTGKVTVSFQSAALKALCPQGGAQ